jgi:hypothetical protein
MEGPLPHGLPDGFRVGTVFEKTLRHVVPPDGRFGICGAPVAPQTIVDHVTEDDRVCTHCIKRLDGRKPFVLQPPSKKPKPSVTASEPAPSPEPIPEPTKVTIELPRRIAVLVDGFFDPVEPLATSRRGPVRYELLVSEAEVLSDVLADMGETREQARIAGALSRVASPPA